MAARSRTTIITECSQRVRNAELELDAARQELKVALAEHGWREMYSHTNTDGSQQITYQRDLAGTVDPISGMPPGSVEVSTFAAFVAGERE